MRRSAADLGGLGGLAALPDRSGPAAAAGRETAEVAAPGASVGAGWAATGTARTIAVLAKAKQARRGRLIMGAPIVVDGSSMQTGLLVTGAVWGAIGWRAQARVLSSNSPGAREANRRVASIPPPPARRRMTAHLTGYSNHPDGLCHERQRRHP